MQESAHQPITPSPYHRINKLVRPFFAVALVLMIVVAIFSEGIFDPGDGILHYQIARWSWKHPELFMHHWGKPVYTLLSSPFAQFGYKGAMIFNVLCHVGAAWLTWRVADRMKLPFAFLAGPLLLFAPISWGCAQSGLTEPLFALTLMLGIYFITAGRNTVAACIISILPFVRTEGFILAPLFGLFFLVRKEYLSMCLLAAGTLLYSIIGAIVVHHDFLWIIHQNPYRGEEMYGHGGLFHFVGLNEFIFGWSITALLNLGFISLVFRKKLLPRHSLAEIILVFGCFFVFFVAHSIFWWKGLFGSYGLYRVIACVLPCAVLVSLRGLQLITLVYANKKIAVNLTLIVVVATTLFNTFRQYGLFLAADEKQKIVQDVATEIRTQHLDQRFLYFGHPLMTHLLDKDPFDPEQCTEMWGLAENPALKKDAIVVWDSHFGPLQYAIPEERLLGIPQLHEVIRQSREYRQQDGKVVTLTWIVCEVE